MTDIANPKPLVTEQNEPTLYEKLGGEPAIDATVEAFYKLVLADPLLSPFFAKSDMKRQHKMQKQFLNHVFGGKPYNGKGMRAAHKNLGLKEEHFNRVASLLAQAMLSLGVKQDLVDEVMTVAATTKNDVLGL
jgi:hemoglobin